MAMKWFYQNLNLAVWPWLISIVKFWDMITLKRKVFIWTDRIFRRWEVEWVLDPSPTQRVSYTLRGLEFIKGHVSCDSFRYGICVKLQMGSWACQWFYQWRVSRDSYHFSLNGQKWWRCFISTMEPKQNRWCHFAIELSVNFGCKYGFQSK